MRRQVLVHRDLFIVGVSVFYCSVLILQSIEVTVVIYKNKTELDWTESGQPLEAEERGNNDNYKNQ